MENNTNEHLIKVEIKDEKGNYECRCLKHHFCFWETEQKSL